MWAMHSLGCRSGLFLLIGQPSLPIGRGCFTISKKCPLLQPRECNAPKTRHHSQIENALRFGRLFQVTLVSPLMSLGHYESENGIMSPARASGTTWAPVACRSLPGGRDFSSNNLILGLMYSAYTELPMFSCHISLPNARNIALSATVWNRLSCTPVIFHQKLFHWSMLVRNVKKK